METLKTVSDVIVTLQYGHLFNTDTLLSPFSVHIREVSLHIKSKGQHTRGE